MSIFNKAARKRSAQELFEIFQAVEAEWIERGRTEPGDLAGVGRYVQAAGFDSLDRVAAMREHYEAWLSHIENLDRTAGCDLGCWLGFSTATLAALGCQMVYGIEPIVNSARLAEDWRTRRKIGNLSFRAMREGVVPLQNESMDWIVINQVFCNALPDSFAGSLREAARVLKSGGWLMLSDANNPYCPDTLERLRKNFIRAELGSGTREAPEGPNFKQRLQIIKEATAQIDEQVATRLARETCYMYGEQLKEAALKYVQSGQLPGSMFRDDPFRPTCIARTGASNGNITDPFALCGTIANLGFEEFAITCGPRMRRLDEHTLWRELTKSQGFFVFARKR